MPVTDANALLAGTGVFTALGGVWAWRRRARTPFGLAYFFTWPLLGSGIILLLQPTPDAFAKTLSPSETARLEEIKLANRERMTALRAEAYKGH
jgi:hypothetical protein